jgi:hypothetical protein
MLNPVLQVAQTPFPPTVLQLPVLSAQFPPFNENPVAQLLHDNEVLVLQLIVPEHTLFLRRVPKPQVMHLVSSEGSYAKHAV